MMSDQFGTTGALVAGSVEAMCRAVCERVSIIMSLLSSFTELLAGQLKCVERSQ
jgi:hypothetical protein